VQVRRIATPCRRREGISTLVAAILLLVIARRAHAAPPPDAVAVEALRSVGYSAWSDPEPSSHRSGITCYDSCRSFKGYNLYTDYTDAAYLMDMAGHIVHAWRFPAGEGRSREFAYMLPNGDLLSHGPVLVKQTWDSRELWRLLPQIGDAYSHDLAVMPDGSLLALAVKGLVYNEHNVNLEIVEHLSANGALLDSWSTFKNLKDLHRFHPPTVFDDPAAAVDSTDYYHANTLRLLPDTPLGRQDARFRKGNWLLCLRQVSLVAIVDQDTRKVVWGWGPGVLDHPHSPVMMGDGQILVFDNGLDRGYSRLVRVDPRTREITWTYGTKREEAFYSSERGYCQPLPNGNILVTSSAKGQAFELTADGQIVWEFFHPDRAGDERRAIYRMIRYPAAMVDALLHPPATVGHRTKRRIAHPSTLRDELG
jgi:hypothetical protein